VSLKNSLPTKCLLRLISSTEKRLKRCAFFYCKSYLNHLISRLSPDPMLAKPGAPALAPQRDQQGRARPVAAAMRSLTRQRPTMTALGATQAAPHLRGGARPHPRSPRGVVLSVCPKRVRASGAAVAAGGHVARVRDCSPVQRVPRVFGCHRSPSLLIMAYDLCNMMA
jgi:hypothetical protein